MRNCLLILFLLTAFSVGCLTPAKTKDKNDKNIESYKADLDADGVEELIEIEDRSIKGGDTFVLITKISKNKNIPSKEYSLTLPGHFVRAEIIDLDTDNFRQMAFFYDTKDSRLNIVIYRFKNNRLSKVFSASSDCDIETDMDLVPRVKVAKGHNGGKDCSVSLQQSDWEIWAWSGEKFVREQ